MKKLIAIFLMLFMMVPAIALSGDIKTDIAGHTYSVDIADNYYHVSFNQGPFGPGPCGKAVIVKDDILLGDYNFYTEGELVIIEDFANFYYREWKLVWIQGNLIVLDGK